MPADANIFSQYLQPPKSVLDYQAAYDQADTRRNALQMAAMDLSEKTQANQRAVKVRNALEALGAGATDEGRIAALKATATPEGFAQADALDKSIQERAKTKAVTGKDNAETDAKKLESSIKAHDFHLQQLGGVNDPESAKAWAVEGLKSGVFTPEQFARGFTNIPTDPAGFAQWKQTAMQGGVSATEQLKLAQQKLIADNTNATHVKTTAMTNATSRANNADTIKKDLTVAGLNGDGTSNGNDDAMVDAIGQYKIAPPNGMALRNPRMQQILAKVAEKYPDFDATSYGARQTAAKSFSTGKDAQNVQAANTALNHLDTVEQLALAQKNGDMVLFNKIANKISAATGQPAPTNLRAAISMVAPELTKAVVGAGGGVSERADFAHNLNPDGSPAQILQGIGAIKELMGGRLSEVERTYGRSTGRKDFRDSFLSPAAQKILAARASADGAPAPTVPSDIAAILDKHGGKK